MCRCTHFSIIAFITAFTVSRKNLENPDFNWSKFDLTDGEVRPYDYVSTAVMGNLCYGFRSGLEFGRCELTFAAKILSKRHPSGTDNV